MNTDQGLEQYNDLMALASLFGLHIAQHRADPLSPCSLRVRHPFTGEEAIVREENGSYLATARVRGVPMSFIGRGVYHYLIEI